MAGIAVVVHVLVMKRVKSVVMVTAQVRKPVTAAQKIVVHVLLMVGHVLTATPLIHGVIVDVVVMI